jgi:hypothetical protein
MKARLSRFSNLIFWENSICFVWVVLLVLQNYLNGKYKWKDCAKITYVLQGIVALDTGELLKRRVHTRLNACGRACVGGRVNRAVYRVLGSDVYCVPH